MTLYDELKARGLIAQVTDEEEIKNLINNGKAVFYREGSDGVAFVGKVSGTSPERKLASLARLLEQHKG